MGSAEKGGELLGALARQINAAERVAVLMGAGISVGAGIPDFRSPGGMYDTLRPELLTATEEQRALMAADPTAVVQWSLFRENPFPYLEVRRPFIVGVHDGQWKPTLAHFFFKELDERGKLRRLYTQNIDGLEHATKLTPEKMVTCHGSLGEVSCEFCSSEVAADWFINEVKTKIKDIYGVDAKAPAASSPVLCPSCGKAGVKPSTVLYGRPLPRRFFELIDEDFPVSVDLLFVVGTSLTVSPANMIPGEADAACPRVIVNNEPVGADIGIAYAADASEATVSQNGRDLFLRGACDESIVRLLEALGWKESFKAKYAGLMAQTSDRERVRPAVVVGDNMINLRVGAAEFDVKQSALEARLDLRLGFGFAVAKSAFQFAKGGREDAHCLGLHKLAGCFDTAHPVHVNVEDGGLALRFDRFKSLERRPVQLAVDTGVFSKVSVADCQLHVFPRDPVVVLAVHLLRSKLAGGVADGEAEAALAPAADFTLTLFGLHQQPEHRVPDTTHGPEARSRTELKAAKKEAKKQQKEAKRKLRWGKLQRTSLNSKMLLGLQRESQGRSSWVVGVLFLDKNPGFDKIREVLTTRLLQMVRFRSRMFVSKTGKTSFKEVHPDLIDLDYHCRVVSEDKAMSDAELEGFLGSLFDGSPENLPDPTKPLWYVRFIPALEDGRAVVVTNISHAIGDGISQVEVLNRLLDKGEVTEAPLKRQVSNIPAPKRAKPAFGPLTRARYFLGGVVQGVTGTLGAPDKGNSLRLQKTSMVSAKKRVHFTDKIPLDKVKEIKRKMHGTTVNDILLALLTLTVRAYFEEVGDPGVVGKKNPKVRIQFPVSIRRRDEDAFHRDGGSRNKFAYGGLGLHLKEKSCADLIWRIFRDTQRLKASPTPLVQMKVGAALHPFMTQHA
ncbi:NAD-dependent protein deacetylase sirtuin-2 (Regulatory protein SIR2 homolog 2) (SIR2-like protein 2) [Durusdinium trenchii]|uniref:NAD-dependent protein deacetylase sirtuin-2 (Regulatory protein SIR2 homolog 2) (SIR2-like protein 2) n=1 Tax=Durusdinium trenchii TaxID=1381693 RepID=A0ABP0LC75_9DINO